MQMLIRRTLLSLVGLLLCLLAGCATYGQDHLFESKQVDAGFSLAPVPAGAVSIYLFRPKPALPMYFPLPPWGYALDGRMLSIMPVGSYIHLVVPPGTHNFTQIIPPELGIVDARRCDLSVVTEAGKTYFVTRAFGFVAQSLETVSESAALPALRDAGTAKFLYRPVSLDVYLSRLAGNKPNTTVTKAPATGQSTATQTGSFLPSGDQVKSFFEGLATVGLVALAIVGAAAGANVNMPSIPEPSVEPPPSFSSSAKNTTQIVNVSRIGDVTKIQNIDTGINYTIKGSQINGSDGTSYRVSGNSMYSSNGEYYQKIGNSVYGNDGSVCTIIGSIIDCKMKK